MAEPPRPAPAPAEPVVPAPTMQQESGAFSSRSDGTDLSVLLENAAGTQAPCSTQDASVKISGRIPHPAATGAQKLRVYSNGTISFAGTLFSLIKHLAHRVVIADWDPQRIIFATTGGEVIPELAWPPPATKYKGITRARYCFQTRT